MGLDARIGVVPWGLVFVRWEVLRRRCQGSCRVLRQGAVGDLPANIERPVAASYPVL